MGILGTVRAVGTLRAVWTVWTLRRNYRNSEVRSDVITEESSVWGWFLNEGSWFVVHIFRYERVCGARVPIVPTIPTALTASITPLLLLLLLLLRHQEGPLYWFASPKGVTQGSPVSSVQFRSVQVSSVQFQFSGSQFKSLSQVRRSTSSSSSQPVEVTQWKSSSRSLFIRSFGWFCWFDSVKVGSDQSLRLSQHKGLHLSDWQSESEQDQGNPHTQLRY